MSTRAPLRYEVIAHTRAGTERIHPYASDEPLEPGQVLRLEGRYWLVESLEPDGKPTRVLAKPARYRLRLHHPNRADELRAVRRYRPDRPPPRHTLTTAQDA